MLKLLSKFILWRYKPKIILVVGNIGKTCAKEAIFCVLSKQFRTKRNKEKFDKKNDVILHILGLEDFKKNPFAAIGGFLKIIFYDKKYPEVFVFESIIKKPGDSKYFENLKPLVVVVTIFGEIPAKVEFFAGPRSMALQKFKILDSVPHFGYAILNYDDETVREMKEEIRARSLTFGFQEGADLKASDVIQQFLPDNLENAGINFKLNFRGNVVPIWLHRVYGKPQVYAALAAAAVGLTFKLNLIEVSEALKEYKSPDSRMTLQKGIKSGWILDDSCEASPASMINAIQTLRDLKCEGRKIAVLGDIIGIGKYTEQAHRTVGEFCSEFLDLLFCIGPRAKFIADEAINRGFPKDKIFSFDTAEEAKKIVQKEIQSGDLILIKGSDGGDMKKIIEEIKEM